ncbi:DUF418 domain-containing protein [Ascidiimonas sp. W6]|uniref:DUF418 domain-containing protein n=1 Tax=Ascidiimonas meishanensis TaxID=3128903 RepID=UPI0030EF2963
MEIKKQRIENIDALRGFALAGIVIAHFSENYLASPAPTAFNEAVHPGAIDSIVDGFIFLFIRGKFFALFSFLFGLSFFLQMSRAHDAGKNYGLRFLWRIVILFGIGYVHHLFYRGDILTVYAIAGVFLIPFYRIPVRWTLAISVLIFLGVFRILIYYITQGNPIFSSTELSPESPDVLNYFKIISEGSLIDVFKINAVDGFLQKMEFQFGVFSRGYLTFGFFLLGLIAGKVHLFLNYEDYLKKIKRSLVACIVLFFVFAGLTTFLMSTEQNGFNMKSLRFMFGLNLYDMLNLVMTLAIICIFILAWRKQWGYKFLSQFTDYGKMALTNYLLQTIFGTLFLYGWGFGYIGEFRILYIFLISIIFIIIQIYLSKLWLKKFSYGPFEWAWRCLTNFKLYSILRNNR